MANLYGMDFQGGDGGMGGGMMGGGGGGDFPPASPSGENRRKPTEEQTLVPVTVKMLLAAASSNNTLEDGRSPHQFKIVAAVREVTKTSTAYNYTVEDGTGCIDVKDWADENNLAVSQMREEAATEHQYIRIIGQLKEYEGNVHMQAYSVRKVSTGNELTHHFLEVVNEAEKYKQGGQIVGSPSMGMGMAMNFNPGMGGNMNMQTSSTPIGMNDGTGGGAGGDGLQSDIITFLRSANDANVGRSILDFIQENQSKYNEGDIRQKFDYLSNEGMIFSTIDEHHYSGSIEDC